LKQVASPPSSNLDPEIIMTTTISTTQHAILAHAIEHHDGKLDWFPDNLKGGARKKVLNAMIDRALITPLGDDWFVAAEGYDALGQLRPAAITVAKLDAIIANAEAAQRIDTDPEIEAAVSAIEATAKGDTTVKRNRDNSKQALVIAMLKRPEGATISQICEATGWQQHTVRGTFAGAFKKKLGLTLISDKVEGAGRVYRIA
jgi:hypothetical protein